jgi:hypothetical protein
MTKFDKSEKIVPYSGLPGFDSFRAKSRKELNSKI